MTPTGKPSKTPAKHFFPIGFWNYCPADVFGRESVRDWADAGMTVAMSPEYDPLRHDRGAIVAILDEARKLNIRVIVCDARSYWHGLKNGEKSYRDGFKQAVRDFGSHPAVMGFHVGDEPDAANFDDACRAMRIQKEIAPSLTPFLNLLPWYEGVETRVGFADWAAYLDAYAEKARPAFFCYDCYSQMNPEPEKSFWGYEMYFANLRLFLDASLRHRIPFWTTLLSVGHFKYRPPKEDDLRWQLNTAVAHGASGILWFFLYMREPHCNYRVAPIDEHWERTETFEWLSRVNRTFLKWHAPVAANLSLVKVSHAGRAWGGFPLLDGRGRVAAANADQPLVVSEFEDRRKQCYVAVVNNSQTQSTLATLAVAGKKPALQRIGWQGAESEPEQHRGNDFCRVQAWLAPGQMELYRIREGSA